MKVFIILAVVCLINGALSIHIELNEEQKAKGKVIFEECVKQENVSEDEVNKLRKRDFSNVTKNMQCFGTCFFEKAGTLKNNEVQRDVVIEKLSPIFGEEKTKSILEKCKDIKGEDRCDTGFKIYECFEKENPITFSA